MDQESIVYGCIKQVAPQSQLIEQALVNCAAILELPGAEHRPLIGRAMFSLPCAHERNDALTTDMLHFGATYQAVELKWAQWIQEFEALLSRMYWVSVTVHLETELSGTHTFTWQAPGRGHVPGTCVSQVRCEWSHEGALQL